MDWNEQLVQYSSLFEVHKWISNTVGLDKDTFSKCLRYSFKYLKYFFKYPTAATKCCRVILGVEQSFSVAKPPLLRLNFS